MRWNLIKNNMGYSYIILLISVIVLGLVNIFAVLDAVDKNNKINKVTLFCINMLLFMIIYLISKS